MKPVAPRRERQRAATIAEIKEAARAQVALGGVQALSLRGVARTMGLTPSALYRYFESHDELVDELAADAFASLADTLEASYAATKDEPEPARRWLLLVRAYRSWAHGHKTEYALLFGSKPHKEARGPSSRCTLEMRRATGVLFRCMIEEIAAGDLDPTHLGALVPEGLRARLEAWGREMGAPLSGVDLAGCMIIWTQLQGFLALEIAGQLPPAFEPDDEMFDQQMLDVLVRIGYRHPLDFSRLTAPSPPVPGIDGLVEPPPATARGEA